MYNTVYKFYVLLDYFPKSLYYVVMPNDVIILVLVLKGADNMEILVNMKSFLLFELPHLYLDVLLNNSI